MTPSPEPQTETVHFPSPGTLPYKGGCVTEPAFFALDYLVNWKADVTVGGTLHPGAPVLPLLKAVLADPQAYGVSAEDAQAAKGRFLDQAGQALVQEGGQRAWLEKEFQDEKFQDKR
ncbi:hypothetical protein Q0M94_14320 [Deinococcus radiomollis]|uniref:hypothetical protein n=1 Tax=Deinococcus radiomollis TaxID=468916 RepID=UPI00389218F5